MMSLSNDPGTSQLQTVTPTFVSVRREQRFHCHDEVPNIEKEKMGCSGRERVSIYIALKKVNSGAVKM